MAKILVISHKVDIDGHGGVILANICYGSENVEYILAMPLDIDEKVLSVICSEKYLDYDKIYITDICPSDSVLSKIADNKELSSRVVILDHHVDKVNSFTREYPFAKLVWQDDEGVKVCGTSLLYSYLLRNKLLKGSRKLAYFVDLTRRYDTWDWKKVKGDDEPDMLSTLMEVLGYDMYIHYMTNKLSSDVDGKFSFTELEKKLISAKKEEIQSYILEALETLCYVTVASYKVGVIYAEKYRNEIKEYILANMQTDMDILAIVKLKDRNISYRSMQEGVDVNEFAKRYGGGGIPKAAGSQFSQEDIANLSKTIFLK